MQQAVGEGRAGDLHMFSQSEAQAERLGDQPLVQPLRLAVRLLRRTLDGKAGTFELNVEIVLAKARQRKGNAVVIICLLYTSPSPRDV